MAKKEKVIKITSDGRFHSMGLVVDSIEEAIKRCEEKGKGNNIFLTIFSNVPVNNLSARGEICGTPDYIKQWVTALSQ